MSWEAELWPEWRVECEIGTGSFGTVYKIVREDIGGTYCAALKVITIPGKRHEIKDLKLENMSDNQIEELYKKLVTDICREISVMEKFKGNSNIVSYEDHKIVKHSNDPGWDILIRMELLKSLPDYLSSTPIGEADVCKIGIDICNALSICEKAQIIHRDLKPDNIFISEFGDFKLGDFGLVKYYAPMISATIPQGTFHYMAPEVYRGESYDYTVDLYALGLIMYRLLNRGREPFLSLPPAAIDQEMREQASYRRLSGEELPKPCDASQKMASIVLKACAYNPYDRFQTADEMIAELRKWVKSQGIINAGEKFARMIKWAIKTDSSVTEKINDSFDRSQKEKNEAMKDFFSAPGDL